MINRMVRKNLSFLAVGALLGTWRAGVKLSPQSFPALWPVVLGISELCRKDLLLKYVIASLLRVISGYLRAVVSAIPFGLLLGWYRRAGLAFGPLLGPISPLAWIPISILWFGVGDLSAIFLIFLASFFHFAVAPMPFQADSVTSVSSSSAS